MEPATDRRAPRALPPSPSRKDPAMSRTPRTRTARTRTASVFLRIALFWIVALSCLAALSALAAAWGHPPAEAVGVLVDAAGPR